MAYKRRACPYPGGQCRVRNEAVLVRRSDVRPKPALSPGEIFPAVSSMIPAGGHMPIRNFGGSTCPAGNVISVIAESCNTAIIDVVGRLGSTTVGNVLSSYQFGRAWPPDQEPHIDPGTPPIGWPNTVDEAAQAAIGQSECKSSLVGLAQAYGGLLTGTTRTARFVKLGRSGPTWESACHEQSCRCR